MVAVAFVAVADIETAPTVEPTAAPPLADTVEPSQPPPPVEAAVAEFVASFLFSFQYSSQAAVIVASMWKYHCKPRRRELSDKAIPPSAWPFGEAC